MNDKVYWNKYEFTVYPYETNWNEVAGLYIFASLEKDRQGIPFWLAQYIGRTTNFSKRIPTHESWPEAVRLGASSVHAMVETKEAKRREIEALLVREYQPPLNVQLR